MYQRLKSESLPDSQTTLLELQAMAPSGSSNMQFIILAGESLYKTRGRLVRTWVSMGVEVGEAANSAAEVIKEQIQRFGFSEDAASIGDHLHDPSLNPKDYYSINGHCGKNIRISCSAPNQNSPGFQGRVPVDIPLDKDVRVIRAMLVRTWASMEVDPGTAADLAERFITSECHVNQEGDGRLEDNANTLALS
jgi:hypothetical protein